MSRWHRVDADELWHFYEGEPLKLLVAENPSEVCHELLGPVGEGCTVAPGFEFAGFRLLADDPQA